MWIRWICRREDWFPSSARRADEGDLIKTSLSNQIAIGALIPG